MGSEPRASTLVLGGSGFLGAHVVALLGPACVAASRESGRAGAGRFVQLDARKPGELGRALGELEPARILDCAAFSSVAEAEGHPESARELNVEVPRLLARWCAQRSARFVHVSTDLVFGARRPDPGGFREEDPPGPISEYGHSKAAGEAAVLEAFPGALVVRLPLLYGDSFGRGRGASDSLISSLATGHRPLLFTDEWRTPLEVGNAARALVELASLDVHGILHVAGPERISRYDFGMRVIDAARIPRNRPREQVRASTRAEARLSTRPEDVSLDSTRARGLLSTPLLGVVEGLERAYGDG
jgi:dTDP-4-dehydrorhamnose reductase